MIAALSPDGRRAAGRRTAVVVSLALLAVAGCTTKIESGSAVPTVPPVSSSEAPSGSVEDFCSAIVEIQLPGVDAEATSGPESKQQFEDLLEASPAGIADDVATVMAAIEAVSELDVDAASEEDPEAFDAVFEILLDPEFSAANDRLEAYTSETCGFEVGGSEDAGVPIGQPTANDPSEADSEAITAEGFQAFFAADPALESLIANVADVSVISGRDIVVEGSGLADDAIAICTAVLDYALPLDPAATVRVGEIDPGSFEVVTEIVGDASTECAPL